MTEKPEHVPADVWSAWSEDTRYVYVEREAVGVLDHGMTAEESHKAAFEAASSAHATECARRERLRLMAEEI